MGVDPTLIIGVATGLGSVATLAYVNRREIYRLKAWAWGEELDETDSGAAGQTRTLTEQIGELGEKIDADTAARRRDHERVEVEIKRNRRLVFDTMGNLVDALNSELPEADIDPADVEPEWYGVVREEDDRTLRDGGGPPARGDD